MSRAAILVLLMLSNLSGASAEESDSGTLTSGEEESLVHRFMVRAPRNPFEQQIPETLTVDFVGTADQTGNPGTLMEYILQVPGVAENGQGGLFQVTSIRGVSRHRVLTLFDGIPISGERRAGVSASFIDPLLFGGVEVLRGPASTYYGSGALGGVIQMLPAQFTASRLLAGYDSRGDGQYQLAAWGDGDWSLGLAHRRYHNSEDPEANTLFDQFEQYSALVMKKWQSGNMDYEILYVPSIGRDIGKANRLYPAEQTLYPEEEHHLLKFALTSANDWQASWYFHPNELTTEDLEPGVSHATVDNESLDFGGNWLKHLSLGSYSGVWGIDYRARREVSAKETLQDLETLAVTRSKSLDDARLDELALYGTLHRRRGDWFVNSGLRYTWQQQDNGTGTDARDSAVTGFAGFNYQATPGLALKFNVGTGFRFPTLSERYFTGTTGRGEIIGVDSLDPEKSVNIEAGLDWRSETTSVGVQVFRLEIDDYIERIRLPSGARTFVNLTSGTIEGVEADVRLPVAADWQLIADAAVMDGEDNDGRPLADIPSDRAGLALEYDRAVWRGRVRYEHRRHKSDVGEGESAVGSADLLSASLSYQFGEHWSVRVGGRNLLDETYYNAADDLAPLSPERSFFIEFGWNHR